MRIDKIASLESRIARLESKLYKKAFYYRMVDEELQKFVKNLISVFSRVNAGTLTVKNPPNMSNPDLILEFRKSDVGLYTSTSSSSPYAQEGSMYEPTDLVLYFRIKQSSMPGLYLVEASTQFNFNRVLQSTNLELNTADFLRFIGKMEDKFMIGDF